MKIGVAGTGAVGGYFGGLLAKAGSEVTFLARGESLVAMKERGLIVESGTGRDIISAEFSDRYESLSEADLVLFCVKSTVTREMAANLQPFLKKDALILTFQNGVDNEEILSDMFGKDRILAAAAYIQAFMKEAGVVKQIGIPPQLVLGSLDKSRSGALEEVANLFNQAGIQTYSSSKVLEVKWKKLLWNVTFNPLTALMLSSVGELLDDPGACETANNICKEAIAVARKTGVEIDTTFHEQIMSQGQLARDHKTSMLQDRMNGKPMEIESICGYIVQKGKEVGTSTPVLETIYHLLKFSESSKPKTVLEVRP